MSSINSFLVLLVGLVAMLFMIIRTVFDNCDLLMKLKLSQDLDSFEDDELGDSLLWLFGSMLVIAVLTGFVMGSLL